MTTFYNPSPADVEVKRADIESLAEDDRYIEKGSGYGMDDLYEDVETLWDDYVTDTKGDLGTDTESPTCKAVAKIARAVWKEMRES